MDATQLHPDIWNAIYTAIDRATRGREVTFGKVIKRDAAKKTIWLEEFGDVAIPLVYFDHSFEYLDTEPVGNASDGDPIQKQMTLRGDKTQKNDAFHVKVIVPRIGQLVCVLNPRASNRFPMCVGVIHGHDYWQGVS